MTEKLNSVSCSVESVVVEDDKLIVACDVKVKLEDISFECIGVDTASCLLRN